MSASQTPELSKQLRDILVLDQDSDVSTLEEFFDQLNAKVSDLRSTNNQASFNSFEEELRLQDIHHEAVDHASNSLYRLEIFLRILYTLQPILSPINLISTWFDLALRPALREPGLSPSAMEHAKQLLYFALTSSNDASEKVSEFQRRVVDLYLLDALNDSSETDILEWSQLDEEQRERRIWWKLNLEDTCIRFGLEKPEELFTILFHCFMLPSTRLQILLLLDRLVSHTKFLETVAVLASHPLFNSLLYSLQLDKSSTLCSVGSKLLFKLVPMMAVKAYEDLKRALPKLLFILARIICWKARGFSEAPIHLKYADLTDQGDVAVITELEKSDLEDGVGIDVENVTLSLSIREELGWECLEYSFNKTESFAPSASDYFSLLYYLFPCNVIAFLRRPAVYLKEHGEDCPYTVNWEDALDEVQIRTRSEALLRAHVAHPSIIWNDAKSELDHMERWVSFDVSLITGECIMLQINNVMASRDVTSNEGETILTVDQNIREYSVRDVEFSSPDSGREPVRNSEEITFFDPNMKAEESVSDSHIHPDDELLRKVSRTNSEAEAISSHIVEIITGLQREVLLSRKDLDLELWMKRQNIQHIGRLYQDRVTSKSAELERQGLHNKLRDYKLQLSSMHRQLKKHQDQALSLKEKNLEWTNDLKSKLNDLRSRGKKWEEETSSLRVENKKIKAHLAAQSKLLSEAQNKVFLLEAKIKEDAHKVQRLRDYEKRIEQLTTMHKMWNEDILLYNQQTKYIDVLTSDCQKMKLRAESFEELNKNLERQYREQILSLKQNLQQSNDTLDKSRGRHLPEIISANAVELTRLSGQIEILRSKNLILSDQNEELTATVQFLNAQLAETNKRLTPIPTPL